eukprot:11196860-Alexandrium_andersonii.AAC.1
MVRQSDGIDQFAFPCIKDDGEKVMVWRHKVEATATTKVIAGSFSIQCFGFAINGSWWRFNVNDLQEYAHAARASRGQWVREVAHGDRLFCIVRDGRCMPHTFVQVARHQATSCKACLRMLWCMKHR